MDGFLRFQWFVAVGWRLPIQDIVGELVVNILQLLNNPEQLD
jgi:hypothetical protein